MATSAGHWWFDLVEGGTTNTTFVLKYQGDSKTWDQWSTIRKCNPLVEVSPMFRRKLLQERNAARRDSRLRARFQSYRENLPSADESTTLLTVPDWQRVLDRPVQPRDGRPVVAYDLGAGRSWSAAVAVYLNGRAEAVAIAPGIPSIEDQEKRDRVPRGLYQRLVASGRLLVADGLRVQTPKQLHQAAVDLWGRAQLVLCDRFNLNALRDVTAGANLVPRISRWSEAAADIRSLRKAALDGPLSCEENSRMLITASLAQCVVKSDDQGSTRLVKATTNNAGRDDVGAALLLAAGGVDRARTQPRPRLRSLGLAG